MPITISGTISNLRSHINCIDPYSGTYTYLKYCKNYIIGYGMNNIQILKRDCLYGGIRDFRAVIKTKQESSINLNNVIRVWGQAYKDLGNQIFGELYKDYYDLGGILKGKVLEAENNLNKIIRGWSTDQKDLSGYLKQALAGQDDLSVYLKQNYANHLDLPNRLKGWVIEAQRNLGSYTKSVIASTKDLGEFIQPLHTRDLNMDIDLIPAQNLQVIIQHDDKVVNLFANIRVKYVKDLLGIIRCKYIYNLPASLVPVEPVDLSARIESIVHINLGVSVDGWLGPLKNLLSYVNAVSAQDLSVLVDVWGGFRIPVDLRTLVQSYQEFDLSASMFIIPSKNLGATLIPKGQIAELGVHIIPKVVYFRSIINVALLEHKDLQAMINYSCFYSDWRALGVSLYCFSKKDLITSILGTLQSADSTYKNLPTYINVHSYYTEDKVIVEYPVVANIAAYTLVNINYSVFGSRYDTYNTIPIYYYGLWPKNLAASITGVFHHRDLSVSLTPEFDFGYDPLPPWINPRTYEVILDIRRFASQARRFVEIMFDAMDVSPYHYFYVDDAHKVYRVDRGRHWSIKTVGYTKVEDADIDRTLVREKQTFNLSNYASIDEAVRSLIDRAASYREVNLLQSISSVLPPYKDLPVNLYAYKTRTWMKNLHIFMQPLRIRDFVLAVMPGFQGTYDLNPQIYKILQHSEFNFQKQIRGWLGSNYDMRCTVRWHKGNYDLSGYVKRTVERFKDLVDCSVVSKEYESQAPDDIIFNFEDSGYFAPTASGITFNFNVNDLTWVHPEYEPPAYNIVRVTRSSIEILRKET